MFILLWKLEDISRTILPKNSCKDCNVILISVDALRSKSIPCYGYAPDTTPNLCEFVKQSYLFANHFSQSASTLDSNISIFTSLYPISHKVVKTFTDILSPNIFTLSQILSREGYQTMYAGPRNDPHFPLDKGLGRGFEKFEEGGDPQRWIEVLSRTDLSRKFFAYLQTYELTEPYLPQKESLERIYRGSVDRFLSKEAFEKRAKSTNYKNPTSYGSTQSHDQAFLRYIDAFWGYFADIAEKERATYIQSLYEAKLYEWDKKFGEFLNYLKQKELLKNMVIVITSDHGESFFEHGTWTHGFNLYNESIKVPLIVYVPEKKGGKIEKLTQSIDIMPTLLYLVGIENPLSTSGISVFSKKENKFAISEHFLDQKLTIIEGRWKLIINQENPEATKTAELYDLKDDPDEKRNLTGEFPNIVTSLEGKLRENLYSQPTY